MLRQMSERDIVAEYELFTSHRIKAYVVKDRASTASSGLTRTVARLVLSEAPESSERLLQYREAIVQRFKSRGYARIVLDLDYV